MVVQKVVWKTKFLRFCVGDGLVWDVRRRWCGNVWGNKVGPHGKGETRARVDLDHVIPRRRFRKGRGTSALVR